MANALKIDGIYDSRTLKFLQSLGVHKFGFNFDPRSFNFVQEYVFIEQLVPLLSSRDQITLSFTRSSDPMIAKVLVDLKNAGVSADRVSIICQEWNGEVLLPDTGFYLYYGQAEEKTLTGNPLFKGFIFDYSLFEEVHTKGLLHNFITNFYTRFGRLVDDRECILATLWQDNIFPGLPEIFDFDTLSLPINSDIEICYRNVDLKKLGRELEHHSLKRSFRAKEKF